MPEKLAVLIVEDSESDAELILRALQKAEYEVVSEQVETAEELEAALGDRAWDVVVSDYNLPQFSSPAALELLKRSGQDIPFIIVSGTIGEEMAVQMMKAGAHDYVLKDNLVRLAPAVARELEQAQRRRERKKIEETLYFFAQRGWAVSGKNFFEALAEYLGKALSVDFVFIDRVYDRNTAKTLANYWLGEINPNLEYLLAGTPCENIYANKLCTYPADIQALFPKDEILTEMGAQSYSGIPLWDSRGEPIGLIALLKRQPIDNVFLIESLLQIVAGYTGYEIERREAEAQLKIQLEELRRWNNMTIGREERILDLKREVNELLEKAGKEPRYLYSEKIDQK